MALSTPAPEGWDWYPIEGTRCRDGSGAGFFLHRGEVEKLVIYLEGGGACLSPGFCAYNPQNVDQILTGDGQTVIGSAFGVVPNRQQPGAYELGVPRGIHELQRPDNPYRGWSQVYVPYCTGDVYAGNKPDAEIEGLPGKQQFVGHMNMRRFVSRWTGTFPAVDTVVLTGSSAGSFGAALNFSMVQDAFAWAQVLPIMDSGLPFTDAHWPPCLQRTFRELWNIDDTLPPDCQGCFQEDGGGLIGLADFLMEKHPTTRLAVMTAAEDEVMRLFFSAGLRSCEGLSISDPVAITLGQFDPNVYIPGPDYAAAIEATWARYQDTGRLAGYVMTGALHQHQFRERFYEAAAGGTTIADFVRAFIAGEVGEVGVSVLAH